MSLINLVAIVLALVYILDRLWKVAAIWSFFSRSSLPEPLEWPALSLIQPVTASPNDLRTVLTSRAQAQYPLPVEHIIVLDGQDAPSQSLCRELMQLFPEWNPNLVLVDAPNGIALKTVKQIAGLQAATGEVLCFIDDDILLRSDTLKILVRYLYQEGIGSTFGLACYTNWRSVWSALMSAFVNANVLLNYIPLTYITEGFIITGHLYAFKRKDFQAINGLSGMEHRLDDDHELARRVVKAGLRNLQTPAIYDVDNELPTLRDFINQMKRWFVFPRELMLPGMRTSAQVVTFIASVPNLVPGLLLALAIFGGWVAGLAAAICLLVFYAVHFWSKERYLKSPLPSAGWLLFPLVAFILPYQIVLSLFSSSTVIWRGQRLRVKRGGEYDVVK